MRRFALIVPLLLAACQQPATPEEEAQPAGEARKPHPPGAEPTPQPIAFTDIEQENFFGAGCAFVPEGREGYDPVLYTVGKRGLVKLGGKLEALAADSGSAEFPYGTRETYSGSEHSLSLTMGSGEGEVVGEESVGWPGSLTIRDQQGRVVYRSAGTLECGA